MKVNRILEAGILAMLGAFRRVLYLSLHDNVVKAGDKAPDFSIQTDNGKTVTARDFGGKLLILNFWATGARPACRRFRRSISWSANWGRKAWWCWASAWTKTRKHTGVPRRFHVSYLTARDPGQAINTKYGTIQYPRKLPDRPQRQGGRKDRRGSQLVIRADGRACPVPPLKLPPAAKIADLVGPRGYLDRPEDLSLYEYDGSVDKARPELVVFPRTTEEVAAIVKITARARRADRRARRRHRAERRRDSTGAGGVTIGFARMNRILEIDIENERAVLQPGVVNLDITLAVQALGYFYAPDPSSQRACTIGGNVAENSGGPHTLAYGVTTNHVLGLEFVMPDGTVHTTGGKEPDSAGYDLTGLLTGRKAPWRW
jgi:peroxiredoxin